MKKEIKILESPLLQKECLDFVSDGSVGGIVSFVGTVRNQTKGRSVHLLEFESYIPMAIKEMDKIADQIADKYPAKAIAIHHRVGSLGIGEIAVIISVACAHRKAAFAACEYAIDTLKKTVPIWKKEIFEDGEVWVSAHP